MYCLRFGTCTDLHTEILALAFSLAYPCFNLACWNTMRRHICACRRWSSFNVSLFLLPPGGLRFTFRNGNPLGGLHHGVSPMYVVTLLCLASHGNLCRVPFSSFLYFVGCREMRQFGAPNCLAKFCWTKNFWPQSAVPPSFFPGSGSV